MKKQNNKKNANCTPPVCVEGLAQCHAKPVKKQNFGKASWKKLAEALADNVRLAALAAGLVLGGTMLTHAQPQLSATQAKEVIAMGTAEAKRVSADTVVSKEKNCGHMCGLEMHMAGQIEAARLAVGWMFGAEQIE